MKLKCYCTDDSVIELDFNIENHCNKASNFSKSTLNMVWQYAEKECNTWNDEGTERTRVLIKIMAYGPYWFEIDKVNKYPTSGVYLGNGFVSGYFYEGDYVLMKGNQVHDDVWDEDKGWIDPISEDIEDILPYKTESTWIGRVDNGEIIRVQ